MKKYERPVVMINEELAEGVYAASGAVSGGSTTGGNTSSGEGCMTGLCYINQTPISNSTGVHYAVYIQPCHDNSLYKGDGHASNGVTVTLNFNMPVTCDGSGHDMHCNCTVLSGNGTNTLTLYFDGDMGNAGTVFWGQVYIQANDGIALTGYSFSCDRA